MWAVVSVMTDNLPIKKNVFHLRTTTDVMNDHIIPVFGPLLHDNTNVSNSAT